MAAGTVTLFGANLDDLRMRDLEGATLKMLLTTSAYTPDIGTSGHSVLADVTNEVAAGNGYLAGGVTLATVAIAAVTGGWKISSDAAVWNADGGPLPAWRNAVIYVDGALWGKTSPLVGTFLGDDTPADIPATPDGNPLTINCPSDGWFDLTQ